MHSNRWLIVTILAATIINLFAFGAGLVIAADAREQNCERVILAFDAYTDALVAASPPRTPEEQADLDRRERAFRDSYEPHLANCN